MSDAQDNLRKFYIKEAEETEGTTNIDLTCPTTAALFLGARMTKHNLDWLEQIKLGIHGCVRIEYDIKPDVLAIKDRIELENLKQ